MSASRQPARTRAQRRAENERYHARAQTVGLVQVSIVVPIDKVPTVKALATEWRAEARALLDSDLPTPDQILQIHAISRTLDLTLPVEAFHTRAAAARWLLAHEPELGGTRPQRPHVNASKWRKKT